jgi:hypothetical protein
MHSRTLAQSTFITFDLRDFPAHSSGGDVALEGSGSAGDANELRWWQGHRARIGRSRSFDWALRGAHFRA